MYFSLLLRLKKIVNERVVNAFDVSPFAWFTRFSGFSVCPILARRSLDARNLYRDDLWSNIATLTFDVDFFS